MRRLYLLGPFPPPHGGVSVFDANLHRHLAAAGYPCVAKELRQHPEVGRDPVLPSFSSVWRHFRGAGQRDVCLDSGTIFVEYRGGTAPAAWELLKRVRRFRWVKVIHDGTLPERFGGFEQSRQRLVRRLAGLVDAFLVTGAGLGEWLTGPLGVQAPVSRIGSLLPLPPAGAAALPPEAARVLASHRRTVCSVGAFLPDYGFPALAEAVERVRAHGGPDVGLLLIDGGFVLEPTADCRAAVTAGRPWVTALTGVPHASTLEVLRRCDLFVRGTRTESYGLSRVESIICGTPVLATPTGETRGMELFPFGDSATLASRIAARLARDKEPPDPSVAAEYAAAAQENLVAILQALGPPGGGA